MKLDFSDLGRSIAGRPEDPIELRPFEFAFTPEKIVSSCKKLGLRPVHLKTALEHKRVRDDSTDGSRAALERTIRERHAAALAGLVNVGIQTDVLVVVAPAPPPPPPPQPTPRLVASPSKAEREWKCLKAAGVCAGAIFHSVGAKAFNGPQITGVAMERLLEKKSIEEEKNSKATSGFTLLRTRVQGIMETMQEEETDYTDLTQTERCTIIKYIFQAQELGQGVTKHTLTADAANEFLEQWPCTAVNAAIADPPCFKGKGRVAKGMSGTVIVAELAGLSAPPLLMAPIGTPYLMFGAVEGLDMGDCRPLKCPAWVEPALALDSPSAAQLVGEEILYKWPPRLGGWARGTVLATNHDKTKMVGKEVCNYFVLYPVDGDTSMHFLNMREYAKNAKAVSGSWVLLGKEE